MLALNREIKLKKQWARLWAVLSGAVLFAVACLSIIVFYYLTDSTVTDFLSNLKKQQQKALQSFLTAKREALNTLATDYTTWEDMWNFVVAPDPTWSLSNLDWVVDGLGFSSVSVLKRGGEPIYEYGAMADWPGDSREVVLQSLLEGLDRQSDVQIMAYIPGEGSLYWLAGARIVHEDDEERTGEFNGYLVVGDRLEAAEIEASTGVRGLELCLPTGACGEPFRAFEDTYLLQDYIGPPGLSFHYQNNLPLVEEQISNWHRGFSLSLVVILFAVVGSFLINHYAFVAPFLSLSAAISDFARSGNWVQPNLRFYEFQAVAMALTTATEQRAEAERQLLQERNELEQRVKERTTELASANQALTISEERYRSVVEDLPVLVCRFNSERKIGFVNSSYCKYFGKQEEDLLGTDFLDLVPVEHHPIVKANLAALSPENATITYEHKVFAGDGTLRWQRWTDRAIIDETGEITGYQSIGEDITETRLLEEQLRQAQKMEVVGRLAGGVAHDFNNMLTVIIGHTQFIAEELAGDEEGVAEDTLEVLKAAERAKNLTQQLLAFSRRQIIEPRLINLNEIVLDTHRMLRRLIGENIELVTLSGEDLGLVRVDRSQIGQVLLNLVVNSRDAMPEEGGIITIETGRKYLDSNYKLKDDEVQPGEYVMLAVSDNGVGMSEEVKAHLFEPFFTTKGLGKGTGLGLATVYGIVKQHKGHIWVYSEKGKGTTFKIYLPLAEEEPQIETEPEEEDLAANSGQVVLVAEDESAVRRVTVRMLQKFGYRVLIASNGDEALRIANQYLGPIDLLITDVVMPQMSGWELAESLRRRKPNIKVLFVSGYTDNDIHHHGFLGEDIEFLSKPFTEEALAKKVQNVLGGRASNAF